MSPLRATATAGLLVLLVACGSKESSSTTPTAPASTKSGASAQSYLDAVNGLCDDLLPKIVAATHGGQLEATAKQYLADHPAHAKAIAEFDSSLAALDVPAAASAQAATLRAYIEFADGLDAARLTAAKAGQAAWVQEVAAEANVENDPTIKARNAAGFAPSCDAR